MSSQQEVFAAIKRERDYQDQKWGTLDTYFHEPERWLDIIGEEVSEAVAAQDMLDRDEALAELLQAAAVIVAALEQHGVVERDVAAASAGAGRRETT